LGETPVSVSVSFREAFERGREDVVGFGGATGRLVEHGHVQRRAYSRPPAPFVNCDPLFRQL